MTTLHFVSPYASAECIRRLKEVVRPWWGGAMDAPRGRVRDGYAKLRMPTWYHNSFQTVLRLSFADNAAGGSDLTCRFGLSRFVLGFMTFWFVGVAGFDVVLAVRSVFAGEAVAWGAAFGPLAMVAMGAALVAVGRFLARNEQMRLLLFLEDTLAARRPA